MNHNQTQEHIYNKFLGIRAPQDFVARFELFSKQVGRSKSQVCRYFLARCLSAYETDKDAMAKIRQEIL
jgi:hypothetical protein